MTRDVPARAGLGIATVARGRESQQGVTANPHACTSWATRRLGHNFHGVSSFGLRRTPRN